MDELGGLGGPLDVPQEFTAPDLASAPGIDGAGLGLGLGDNGLAPTEFSGAGLDAPLTSAALFTPASLPAHSTSIQGSAGRVRDSSAPFLNTPLLPPAPLARSANSDTRVSGVTEFPGLTTPALDVPSFERRGGLPVSTDQGAWDTSFTLPKYSPAEFPGLPG